MVARSVKEGQLQVTCLELPCTGDGITSATELMAGPIEKIVTCVDQFGPELPEGQDIDGETLRYN